MHAPRKHSRSCCNEAGSFSTNPFHGRQPIWEMNRNMSRTEGPRQHQRGRAWLASERLDWVRSAERSGRAASKQRAAPWFLAACFLVSLVLPFELSLQLGELRVAPPRVVAIIAFFPTFIQWFRWGPQRWLVADYLVLGSAAWSMVSLFVNDTMQKALEFGGASVLEGGVAYMIARTTLVNAAGFDRLMRVAAVLLMGTMLVMLPEFLTGVHWTHELATQLLGGTYETRGIEHRLGLMRSFGPFDHPIIAGVFGSAFLLLLWPRGTATWRSRLGGLIGAVGTAVMSISSAAILSACLQGALALYRRALRRVRSRWLVLFSIVFLLLFCASVLAEGALLPALVRRLTLDPQTGYYRMMIWDRGFLEVAHAPWLGAGVNHWFQASLENVSVDSFWLLITMKYGIPYFLMVALAAASLMIRAGRWSGGDSPAARTAWAWLVCMLSFVLCGFTVHYWNSAQALFFFILGAGAWIGTPTCAAATPAQQVPGAWLSPVQGPLCPNQGATDFGRRR